MNIANGTVNRLTKFTQSREKFSNKTLLEMRGFLIRQYFGEFGSWVIKSGAHTYCISSLTVEN